MIHHFNILKFNFQFLIHRATHSGSVFSIFSHPACASFNFSSLCPPDSTEEPFWFNSHSGTKSKTKVPNLVIFNSLFIVKANLPIFLVNRQPPASISITVCLKYLRTLLFKMTPKSLQSVQPVPRNNNSNITAQFRQSTAYRPTKISNEYASCQISPKWSADLSEAQRSPRLDSIVSASSTRTNYVSKRPRPKFGSTHSTLNLQPKNVSNILPVPRLLHTNNNFASQHNFSTPTNIWLPERNQIFDKMPYFPFNFPCFHPEYQLKTASLYLPSNDSRVAMKHPSSKQQRYKVQLSIVDQFSFCFATSQYAALHVLTTTIEQ